MGNEELNIRRLRFFKDKIDKQLENIREDIGNTRYRIYKMVVDQCNNYDELRDMAELELQMDSIKYERELKRELEELGTNVKELREANESLNGHIFSEREFDEETESAASALELMQRISSGEEMEEKDDFEINEDEFEINEDDFEINEDDFEGVGHEGASEQADEFEIDDDEFEIDDDEFEIDDDEFEEMEGVGNYITDSDETDEELELGEESLEDYVFDDSTDEHDEDTDEFEIDEDDIFGEGFEDEIGNYNEVDDEFDIDEDDIFGDDLEGYELESEDVSEDEEIDEDDIFGEDDLDDLGDYVEYTEDKDNDIEEDDIFGEEEDNYDMFDDISEDELGGYYLDEENNLEGEIECDRSAVENNSITGNRHRKNKVKRNITPKETFNNGTERGDKTQKMFDLIHGTINKTGEVAGKNAKRTQDTVKKKVKGISKSGFFELSEDGDDLIDF